VAQPGVVRIGHTGDAEFSLLSDGIDACINLRQPSAGETSGIAMRLMALGKPVILTDSEENSRLPEDGCLRVPRGEAEADALAESMSLLAQFPEAAREIGRRGQAHVREHHALERVAGLYWRVLEESLPDNS